MITLADHIIAIANKNDLDVTNLQLQKVTFISLGMHMRSKKSIDKLARDLNEEASFSKWKYGPVVENLYYRYNIFGSSPIMNREAQIIDSLEHLNDTISQLLKMDVFKLVKFTHALKSWSKFEKQILEGKHVEDYTLEEIFEDFKDAD